MNQKYLAANVQNSVSWVTWHMGFMYLCHECVTSSLYVYRNGDRQSNTQHTLFTHHSYMFQLPQHSHHHAVQNQKRKFICIKVTGKILVLHERVTVYCLYHTHCSLKAYCAILVRRSNFRHQASPLVSPRESTQRRKAELWARNVR
jgi:hypothetical protein